MAEADSAERTQRYRRRADEIREVAKLPMSTSARVVLLQTADHYDHLADAVGRFAPELRAELAPLKSRPAPAQHPQKERSATASRKG